MANLALQPVWTEGVYQFEAEDPVQGGPGGIDNKPASDLGNRTEYLKQFADEVEEARGSEATLKDRIEKRGVEPQNILAKFRCISDEPVAVSTEQADIVTGGLLTIDGISCAVGDLVLLKDQTDAVQNGFWEVQTGAWNRYTGYTEQETDRDCFTYKFIPVQQGTVNAGKIFFLDTDTYTVGTDALAFLESVFSSWEIPGKAAVRDRRGRSRDTETLTHWKEGQNLLDVLGVSSVAEAMEALRVRCNGTGKPDFSGLRIGDYLDLPSLTVGGTTYQWNESYQNLRLVLSGFNQYKGCGDTENAKNHFLFTFRNCVLTRQMNAANDNTGGYAASAMRTFLEGDFKTGLAAALGGDYIYPVRRLLDTSASAWAWETDTVFLPTEYEVMGAPVWSRVGYGGGFQCQFPIFRESCEYLVKRYNGSRQWWWEASSAANFCEVSYHGYAIHYSAGSAGGCAPDSVRYTMCRLLVTDIPDTEGETVLPTVSPFMARRSNKNLDASGRTLFA